MPSPLWRHAPSRAWRAGGSGLLMLAALTAATASVASVPMFAQQAGDSALASTLATVPDDARTSDAAALRLVGGRSPRSEDQQAYLDRLAPHQPPLPESERAGREVLSLPLSPAHSDDDVRDAIAALQRVHARFTP